MGLSEAVADCETVSISIGERTEHVATIELSRPDARNALNAQLREELKTTMVAVEESDVRAVVVTGDPDGNAFVAGADLTELRERNSIEQREVSERPRVYERVADCSVPVIARINGHALGGGCELIQACDIRIAHERAKIGQPEINLGIIPGGGGTQRLPRLVGEGQAMKLILSGELIDAKEAVDIGLVEEVHDDETFDERVTDLATSIAQKSPLALRMAKTSVKAASQMDLRSGIEYEAELFAQLFDTEDKNEGIDAFFQDRDPEWSGQ